MAVDVDLRSVFCYIDGRNGCRKAIEHGESFTLPVVDIELSAASRRNPSIHRRPWSKRPVRDRSALRFFVYSGRCSPVFKFFTLRMTVASRSWFARPWIRPFSELLGQQKSTGRHSGWPNSPAEAITQARLRRRLRRCCLWHAVVWILGSIHLCVCTCVDMQMCWRFLTIGFSQKPDALKVRPRRPIVISIARLHNR